MGATLKISGTLSEADIRRLSGLTRRESIGPTTVYYAGLTAPVIAAAVTLVVRSTFSSAGISTYWTFLLSTLIAALAGISWYLIFMRWASRDRTGRDGETEVTTTVSVTASHLELERGEVTTRIGWAGVRSVDRLKGGIAIFADGSGAIIVPDSWFADADTKTAFHAELTERVGSGR